ncbi:MAG: hypothetical protein Q9195_009145, partial [Heterodermia aff. obscurata]
MSILGTSPNLISLTINTWHHPETRTQSPPQEIQRLAEASTKMRRLELVVRECTCAPEHCEDDEHTWQRW